MTFPRNLSGSFRLAGLTFVVLAAFSFARQLSACAVPVFRYALERDSWHPAPYSVFMSYRGEPGYEARDTLRILEEAARQDGEVPANILVRAVELASPPPDDLEPLWRHIEKETPPRLAVCAPGRPYPFWMAEATAASAAALLESPARREIQQQLARGVAAVWVLLESGQADQDNAAAEVIRRATGDFAQTFRFSPEAVEAMRLDSAAGARISFSIIRITHNDPAEDVLKAMLLSTEPDLRGLDGPMAFAVYGRGRTHWALVGKGVSPKNVHDACAYITGDCSCEVKADNPGADLLFRADWYKILAGVAPPPFRPDGVGRGVTATPLSGGSRRTAAALLVTAVTLLSIVTVVSLLLRRGRFGRG